VVAHDEDVFEAAVREAVDQPELQRLEGLGRNLVAAGSLRPRRHAGRCDRDRYHRRQQRVAEPLRDLDAAVARHDGVTAQDVVRTTGLGSAGNQEDRCLPLVVNLLVRLARRQQFELDEVVDIERLLRLCQGQRGRERADGERQHCLLHTASKD
jgi:hypothetical protein